MLNPFAEISEKNKRKLLRQLEAHTIFYKKKDIVNAMFKDDNYIGIIVSGMVQINKADYNGNISIVDELQENELFSTNINIDNKNTDIIAQEDSEIIILNYDYLLRNINSDKVYFNKFIKNMFLIFNEKIKEKNERIEILSKKTIREKLLCYFDIERNKHGSKFIYLPFNFKDLAAYLAIDRTAMSRELKYLKEEGFIEVNNKKITLINR